MRIVTVAGVMTLGLGLGTLAVLGPFASRAAAPTETSWLSSLSATTSAALSATLRQASYLADRVAEPKPSAANTPPAPAAAVHDTQTLAFLTQPAALTQAADARVVEKPWAAQVTPAGGATPRKMTSSKPTTDDQRRELVSDIQRELKRVGCYDGTADGQWNGSTKRAMGSFAERVNASLPYEEPDLILLTLVKGQRGLACGKDCPAGQGHNDNGHCTPNSILARADRSPAERTKIGRADAGPTQHSDSKPVPRDLAANTSSSWSTTVIRTPAETGSIAALAVSPAAPAMQKFPEQQHATAQVTAPVVAEAPVVAPARVVASADVSVRSAQPLPGRMAIGAPLPVSQNPELPATLPAPAKPEKRLAAAAITPDTDEPSSVTATEPVPKPAAPPKVHRDKPASAKARPAAPPAIVHAPKRSREPVVGHRPSQPVYRAPVYQTYVQRPPSHPRRSADSYVYQLVHPPGT